MKEIKFRAKRIDTGEWVYGYYIKHLPYTPSPMDTVDSSEYEHYIIKDGFSDWNMPRDIEHFRVDPKTISQFTGLKDKNEKEIYEGDIVIFEMWDFYGHDSWTENAVVIFDEKGARVNYGILKDDKEYEVIGNIHNNPELLEK